MKQPRTKQRIRLVVLVLCYLSLLSTEGTTQENGESELQITCRSLLNRTSKAAQGEDSAAVQILNAAYRIICEQQKLPEEYDKYYQELRKKNSQLEAACLYMGGITAGRGGGSTHIEVKNFREKMQGICLTSQAWQALCLRTSSPLGSFNPDEITDYPPNFPGPWRPGEGTPYLPNPNMWR
jgi:hypothetical protein